MKKIVFSSLLILFSAFVIAQKNQFLKVPALTEEELKSTKSTLNPDAAAEILYSSYHYRIDYQGVMYKDVVNRVKIYNKDKASDYLDTQVSIYDGKNGREKLLDLKAYTYNFENGKIKSTKVEKDSKFKSTEDKNYNITKLAFPDVKNGSVLEYNYSIETPFYYSIDKVMVEREIPIKYFEYILDAPTQLGYTLNYTGTLVPKYRIIEDKEMYGGPHKTYRFGYENIPAYKDENFVGNNNNFKTSIKPEVNSTYINNDYKRYALTWEDVRKNLYENDDFGGELKKSNAVKNILPANISSISNQNEKADAIFQFVQDNYKWNNEIGVIANEGVKNLISTKIGNSAEINFLLILLMKDAGLEANPVVLSTVGRGLLKIERPSITQLNYVVAEVLIGEASFLYDASSKWSSKNMLPPRALNYMGFLFTDKLSKQIAIGYKDKSETELTVDAKLNTDGTFSGHFSDSDTKFFGMMAHEMYDKNKDDYQKTYKDKYSFPLKNLKSGTKNTNDFETSFDFDSDTFVDAIGNKLVFNPLLFLFSKSHDFDQETERKSPIEFYTAYSRKKKVTITLPEGYVFENLPASKRFRTEGNEISYLYFVEQKGNQLIVETTTTLDSEFFPKEYYPAFKQVFDNITKMEGQVVTAVKK